MRNALETFVSQNELKRHRKWAGNKRENKACLGKYKIFEKILPKAGLLGSTLVFEPSHQPLWGLTIYNCELLRSGNVRG